MATLTDVGTHPQGIDQVTIVHRDHRHGLLAEAVSLGDRRTVAGEQVGHGDRPDPRA